LPLLLPPLPPLLLPPLFFPLPLFLSFWPLPPPPFLQAHGQWHWSLGQAFNFLLLSTTQTLLLSMVVSFTSKVVSSVLDELLEDSDVSLVLDDDEDEEDEDEDSEWVSV
jgi:hypothetical protein